MNSHTDRRQFIQDYIADLNFDVIEIYGNVPEDWAGTLTARLVPASLERLLVARKVVNEGVNSAGTYVRSGDILTPSNYHLGGVGLFLSPLAQAGKYALRLHGGCHANNVFVTGYMEISDAWFKDVLMRERARITSPAGG